MFKLVYILLLISSGFSKDVNYIHWNTVSFPPSLIPAGVLKNQGYSDIVRNTIIVELNSFRSNVETGNSKLAITNLKRLQNGCFSGLNMNKKRKKFVKFSDPVIYSFPNELTIKKNNAIKFKKYLTNKNEIDFLQLLKDDKLNFGYVDSRAYNSYIDEIINKFKSNKYIFERKGSDLTKGLLQMLAFDRLDYIIEYPTMVKYNKEKYNIQEEFIQYPIKNASDLIRVYVGCSKTKDGERTISYINKIIKKNKNKFANAYKKWIPKNSLNRYDKVVNNKLSEVHE